MRSRTSILVLTALAVAACHRTAEEPASHVQSTAAASVVATPPAGSASSALAGRCVDPTPDTPPPAAPPGPAKGCPADPTPGYALPTSTVEFPDAKSGGHLVVEMARTPQQTTRGLMFRTTMPEDHGMWFDLGERDIHPFWMHNTCISLDLLYLDEDGLVVGIVENAPTLNDEPRGVACPSAYVLEVNAGWARRHGVRAGMRAVIPPRA
jgi:uncharacterized membrane protein (UPF0127 family)